MVESNTSPLGTSFTVPVDHQCSQDRHHGPGAGHDDPGDHRSDEQAGGFRPARPPVSAGGQGRGRAAPRRAHRSDGRSGPPGRPGSRPACCARFSDRPATGPTRERLFELAAQHKLEIISIEELIRYRRRREKLVYRDRRGQAADALRPVQADLLRREVRSAEAVRAGDGRPEQAAMPLVRLHSSCFTGDVLGSLRCDCGDQLTWPWK